MQSAVDVALANSLRLGIAREEALMATAERLAASSELGLKVSGTAIAAKENTRMIYASAPSVTPVFYARLPDRDGADFNLMAMLPLFTGGRLQALLAGARATEKAALARQAWQLLDVARDARNAYARVLLAREKLDVAGWDVAQELENTALVQKQYELGKVARYLLLRARAELANARQMQNDARAALAVEEAALKSVLGVDMSSSFDYVGSLGALFPPAPASGPPFRSPAGARTAADQLLQASPRVIDDAMRQALASRPDLLAARLDVESAGQAVRSARARYAPQLYAVGMLEGVYAAGRSQPDQWNGGYSLGAVLSFPILDAGERRADVLRAQALRRRRDLDVQSLELEVTRQVVEAEANQRAARENVALSDEEVARAEEDLRVARLRFEVGRAIHLEVVDALRTVARARLNRLNARYQLAVAQADLLRATGVSR
jgi:outer membrane protein TolC